MQGSRPLRNEIANTPDFWSTIRGLHTIPTAASSVFELLVGIMADTPSAITADNYEFAIEALIDFATAGSAGAMFEQKRDRNKRRSKAAKPIDARLVPWLHITPAFQTEPWVRDNEIVGRGIKAVTMIYQLSSRVPALIEQSHLERKEGSSPLYPPLL